jgi:MoxR-like ATPase
LLSSGRAFRRGRGPDGLRPSPTHISEGPRYTRIEANANEKGYIVSIDTVDFESADDIALADKMKVGRQQIIAELQKRIIGQGDVIELILLSLFVGGNSLIVGVPGLAKTLLVATLAKVLELKFNRIQFTPDLMPSDITGTDIIQEDASGRRSMVFAPGPIFANIVLADEINRTPPKTQSALLEAMQEHRVTIQGRTYDLIEPFFVFATQNPIELEGTYPLPEAQLDRFMFHIVIEHPPEDEEFDVVRATTAIIDPHFQQPVNGADLVAFQRLVRRVPVADAVLRYALHIVRTSRPKSAQAPELVKKFVAFGGSVRAAQYLVLGAKARALTNGRYHVSYEDIRSLAHPVLRHRVLTNFRAESEGITSDAIIDELLTAVPVPKSGM